MLKGFVLFVFALGIAKGNRQSWKIWPNRSYYDISLFLLVVGVWKSHLFPLIQFFFQFAHNCFLLFHVISEKSIRFFSWKFKYSLNYLKLFPSRILKGGTLTSDLRKEGRKEVRRRRKEVYYCVFSRWQQGTKTDLCRLLCSDSQMSAQSSHRIMWWVKTGC